MAEKKTAVSGTYQSQKQAEQVVPVLLAAGFSNDAIAVTKAPEGNGARLTVHCVTSEEIDSAKDALKQTDAQEISSSAEEPDKIFVES
jgi:hypothetical protein